MAAAKKGDLLFKELNEDANDPGTTEIESACMQCFKSGITRLLLTKIPFFREVVLMSFKCEHCGFENTEIQSAAEIQLKGVRYELQVLKPEDLNRRLVSSDYTSFLIPEVELEIPAQSQKGQVTTVEGIINRTINGLEQDQEKRRIEHPDAASAIDAFVVRLNELRELKKPFHLHLEDLSGNCFIQNPHAPTVDTQLKITHFTRTEEQDKLLGIYDDNKVTSTDRLKEAAETHLLKPIAEGDWTLEDLHGEIMQFHTKCSECGAACETNMKLTNIPHFKEVIIMATICDACGNKTNEVKSGGGVEEHGVRFEVRVENGDDLSRDVLKSETCSLRINELDCEVGPSALEGRFTTIEGILVAMKAQLQGDGILFDDSADPEMKDRMKNFLIKFDDIIKLKLPATIILDDPAGNSYVQSLCDDDDNETDEKLKIIKYKRTFEQNEELGLNDIKTENYEETS